MRGGWACTPRGQLATTTVQDYVADPLADGPATDLVTASYAYDPAGRLAGVTDAMGRTESYTYYADGLLAEVIADDAVLNGDSTPRDVVLESRAYDAAGNLTRLETGDHTLRTDYTYDQAGRLVSETADPDGEARTTRYTYDRGDNIVAEEHTQAGSDRVETLTFTYDDAGHLTSESVDNGGEALTTRYQVDDRGLTTAVTDPRGTSDGGDPAAYTTTLRYDELRRLVSEQGPLLYNESHGAPLEQSRPTTLYGYDAFGNATHVRDPQGEVTTTEFDRSGRPVAVTAPAYRNPLTEDEILPRQEMSYDGAGRLAESTDTRGGTTSYTYDALGNLVQQVQPRLSGDFFGGAWTSTYTPNGELLSSTDPTGARVEYTYDDLGRRITETAVERQPVAAAYTVRTDYTPTGLPATVTQPDGAASTIEYNPLGEPTTLTDALGNTNTIAYDLAGRMVEERSLSPEGDLIRERAYGYDAAGNQTTATSAEGDTVQRVYDGADRLRALIEPVTGTETITTSFGYDTAHRPTRMTDGRGNTTHTTYNTLGLPESVIEPATDAHPDPADRTWTTGYDAAGNPVEELQPGGVRIQRAFDALGRLTEEAGTGAEAPTDDRRFTYDLMGRPLTASAPDGTHTYTHNDRGSLLTSTDPSGFTATFSYDGRGQVTGRSDLTGTVGFDYDPTGQLAAATDPLTGTSLAYDYDPAGRLSAIDYAADGTRRTFDYDGLGRLTDDRLLAPSGEATATTAYAYDREDRLVEETTTGVVGAGTHAYTYDAAGRLTSWTDPSGSSTGFTYDAAGNRTGAGGDTFTYDERNRLLSGPDGTSTYTPRGTQATQTRDGATTHLAFDAFDQLIDDGTATYAYDALGRLRSDDRPQRGTLTHHYADTTNNLIATSRDGAPVGTFGRDPFGNVLSTDDTAEDATAAEMALTDQHTDVTAGFDPQTGAVTRSVSYDPFGDVIDGEPTGLGYQSAWTDPDSGRVNMHARWYDPAAGRFTSRDTLTLTPDPSVQANRYVYGNADPLGFIDPDGHAGCRIVDDSGRRKGCGSKTANRGGGKRPSPPPRTSGGTSWNPGTPSGYGGGGYSYGGGSGRGSGGYTSRGPSAPPKPAPPKPDPRKQEIIDQVFHPSPRPPMAPGISDTAFQDHRAQAESTAPVTDLTPDLSDIAELMQELQLGFDPSDVKPPVIREPLIDLDDLANLGAGILDASIGMCPVCMGTEWAIEQLTGIGRDERNEIAGVDEGSGWYQGGYWGATIISFFVPGGGAVSAGARAGQAGLRGAANTGRGQGLLTGAATRGCNSFVPGTDVVMADGTTADIEDIDLGEEVLATDPETGETGPQPVLATITGHGTKNLVEITLDPDATRGDDGRGDDSGARDAGGTDTGGEDGGPQHQDTITATDEHPFWVPDRREWVNAEDLHPGTWLRTSSGTWIQVASTQTRTAENQRVHNLTIAGPHTYYVSAGATPLLTHNCVEAGGFLYRGIPMGHPAYDDALQGRAVPRGGHSDPGSHAGGNTRSVFTSWTHDYEDVALDAAEELGPGGIVLRLPRPNIPREVDIRIHGTDFEVYEEMEHLLRGPIGGAEISINRGPWSFP
ncbi:RHS repeat-associated core domain-containing protein [Nocardiopsis trehalosi]|uniref:RHS repeat-associated core domain-containing protein n=1 Tax=Nocardiopsis trehalosi TaxID=109329 RepID=UPI00083357D9|nr:RHS repeat-associated core domain-containing protein [Nocardiopsis trehalosi]